MIKVAISGNIASGKSQVEKILSNMGYSVIDCDKINNNLIEKNSEVIEEIKLLFGADILMSNGNISKQKLSEIAFNFNEKRKKLENILHKKIYEQINIFFKKNKNEKITFVAIPLLFEAKWEKYFDKIIFISADEEIRLTRLMKRNNYTKEQAFKRMQSQESEQEKIIKSDYVIYNNSDLFNLEQAVKKILNKIEKNSY